MNKNASDSLCQTESTLWLVLRVWWSLANVCVIYEEFISPWALCPLYNHYWTSVWGHLVFQLHWSGQFPAKIQPLHYQPLIIAPITQAQNSACLEPAMQGTAFLRWCFQLVFEHSWINSFVSLGSSPPQRFYLFYFILCFFIHSGYFSFT